MPRKKKTSSPDKGKDLQPNPPESNVESSNVPQNKNTRKKNSRKKKKNPDDQAFSLKRANRRNNKGQKHNPRPEGIFQLMKALTSPAKSSCEVNPPSIYKTPPRGSASPHGTHFTTPKGSILYRSQNINCDDGDYNLYLPQEKVEFEALILPEVNDWLKTSPVVKASFAPLIDEPINWKRIESVREIAQKNQDLGKNARGITQNALMKFSATKALQNAGFEVAPRGAHWTHLLPWALVGIQEARNLGIGTSFANARMELINRPLEEILKNSPEKTLYMSAIPTWVKGFESIRLLESVDVIIRDGLQDNFQVSATITFDMLSKQPVCQTEIESITTLLKQKFERVPYQIGEPDEIGEPENAVIDQNPISPRQSLHFQYQPRPDVNPLILNTPPKRSPSNVSFQGSCRRLTSNTTTDAPRSRKVLSYT